MFRKASSRDVFAAIGRFAEVSILFDPTFRAAQLSIDLRNTSLHNALQAMAAATGSFIRMTAPGTITIIPDTPGKRQEYQREVVRTFYLSNADLEETIDLLRIVMDLRRLAPITATNAITIKDTPERVAAAAKVIRVIDKARPEVVIDVELLEVDRQRFREYGLQFASAGSPGLDGRVDVNRDGLTLQDLTELTQGDLFVTSVPSLFYRLLKRDANTRTLANPHLRTSEGLPAQARFGERVPVPVTTFAPIATGGVAQQPITSFNYENIGVNIDITPRTHHNGDVSLALEVSVSNISGTGFGDLPTFGNRYINTTIRLKDGETNLLAGLIRDDERTVLEGIPGLIDLPVVGRLFGRNRTETQETDIILTLTPHIVRGLDLDEADLRPLHRRTGHLGAVRRPELVLGFPRVRRVRGARRTLAAPDSASTTSAWRRPAALTRALLGFDSDQRPERPQPLHDAGVAPFDRLQRTHAADPVGREGRSDERHSRTQITAVERAAAQLSRPGDDDAMRVAEE